MHSILNMLKEYYRGLVARHDTRVTKKLDDRFFLVGSDLDIMAEDEGRILRRLVVSNLMDPEKYKTVL